jgi:hypothetical protein
MTEQYADRVRSWAAELRTGSTRTWAEVLASGRLVTISEDVSAPLPGAAQLELVRRLAAVPDLQGEEFPLLADLVLGTAGPGRGLVDVPLPWTGPSTTVGRAIGTPPVAPEQLPAEELLRVCTGVLVRLLANASAAAGRSGPRWRPWRPWRPWRHGVTLLGAPTTVSIVREALLERSFRDGGGARSTHLVLGAPLEELMAQQWAARVRAGAALRWPRMWRRAATHDRLPPPIALPAIASRLATEVGASRVHVVLGKDAAETTTLVGEVLGVRIEPPAPGPDHLATDLLRRLNPVLTLAVGEDRRRAVVDRVWPEVASGEAPGTLGVPRAQLDWAVETGEQMADTLAADRRAARYAVHGDPALLVPTRLHGVPRAPDPEDVLAHALHVVARAWRRRPTGSEAAEGQD